MTMKFLRALFISATLVLGLIMATTMLPVPAARAITLWPFGVHAHVDGSTGLWKITNNKNTQVAVKYRVRLRKDGIWQNHNATIPANSDRLLGYDSKTYKMEVVSHNP
jgi:hypothetical protein